LFISGGASIIIGSLNAGKLSGGNTTISVIKPSSIRRTSSARARQALRVYTGEPFRFYAALFAQHN